MTNFTVELLALIERWRAKGETLSDILNALARTIVVLLEEEKR